MDDLGGSNAVDVQTPSNNTTTTTDTAKEGEGLALDSGEERVLAYERQLNALHAELVALAHNRTVLASMIERESLMVAQFSEALAPTLANEQSIIDVLKEVSTKEHSVKDVQQRRIYEQERWKHIEEWYAIEQEKWKIQEDLEEQRKRTEEHLAQHVLLTEKEGSLTAEINRIAIEKEKEKLQLALSRIVADRVDAETKLSSLEGARENALAQFDSIRQTEELIEKKEEDVETMLLNVHSLTEERTLSEERYALEKERHEIEFSRWKIEDEMTQLGSSVVESEKLFGELKQKEVELTQKLTALTLKIPMAPSVKPQQQISQGEEGVVPPSVQ